MWGMGQKSQLIINMFAAICAFLVQAGINFILAPFVTSTLGVEAYGFVTLSNSMASYASIITIAITSMASRFIAIAFYRNDRADALNYYSSTIATLLVCIVLIAVPSVVCIISIDSLLNISSGLIGDVRVLMMFVLANFSVSLMSSNLSIGFYIANKLYIASLINATGYCLRAALMLVLFLLLPAHVWIVGAATFLATSFVQLLYLRWKKKLIPSLVFSKSRISLHHAAAVLKSGVWNSVTQLGGVLSNGLDVLVANLMLGATSMGVLSVSKVIPQAMDSIGSAVTGVFQPTLTRFYADGDIDGLIAYAKWAMKCFGLVVALPIGIYLAIGVDFFKLWVPSQDSSLLFTLSALSIGTWAVMGPTVIVQTIFTVLNKIKVNSLLIFAGGLIVIGVEIALLALTDWGLYAIAATSFTEKIIRNMLYTIPAGARYLGRPWWEFYPAVGRSILCVAIVFLCGCASRYIVVPVGWASLIACGLLGALLGSVACSFVLFGVEDRKKVCRMLRNRLRRWQ